MKACLFEKDNKCGCRDAGILASRKMIKTRIN